MTSRARAVADHRQGPVPLGHDAHPRLVLAPRTGRTAVLDGRARVVQNPLARQVRPPAPVHVLVVGEEPAGERADLAPSRPPGHERAARDREPFSRLVQTAVVGRVGGDVASVPPVSRNAPALLMRRTTRPGRRRLAVTTVTSAAAVDVPAAARTRDVARRSSANGRCRGFQSPPCRGRAVAGPEQLGAIYLHRADLPPERAVVPRALTTPRRGSGSSRYWVARTTFGPTAATDLSDSASVAAPNHPGPATASSFKKAEDLRRVQARTPAFTAGAKPVLDAKRSTLTPLLRPIRTLRSPSEPLSTSTTSSAWLLN